MARPNESAATSPRAESRLPAGTRIACVSSTYHSDLVDEMLASARETLAAAGLAEGGLVELRVPGAFELPIVARRLARRGDVNAVLAFGLVLKGETEHDRYISQAVADGLLRVGLETDTPVLFGLLTCPTLEHARARARRTADGGLDKGREVARAAVEVLNSLRATEEVTG